MKKANVHDTKEFSVEKFVKKSLFDSDKLATDIYCFRPGQILDVHQHPHSDQAFYVIEGTGVLTVGTEKVDIGPGDSFLAPAAVEHSILNSGGDVLTVFQVTTPKL